MDTATADTQNLMILNCTDGDTKFSFDPDKPEDVARADRMITDMMRRGYSIFVEGKDGVLKRATRFDPKTREYILQDTVPAERAAKTRGRPPGRRVPARGSKVAAVGLTSGG